MSIKNSIRITSIKAIKAASLLQLRAFSFRLCFGSVLFAGPLADERAAPVTFPLLTAALYKAECVLVERSGVCLNSCL